MVKLNHLRDHDDPDEEEATPQSSVNRPPVKPGMSRTGHLVAATLLSVAAFAPGCVNTVQAPCPPSPCAGPDAGAPPPKKRTLTPKKPLKPKTIPKKKPSLDFEDVKIYKFEVDECMDQLALCDPFTTLKQCDKTHASDDITEQMKLVLLDHFKELHRLRVKYKGDTKKCVKPMRILTKEMKSF